MADTKVAPGLTSEVVNGRTIYKNAKGERVKADGSPYAKRGEGGGAPKKPAYIVYKSDGAGGINIVLTSRNAEEVLKAVEADRECKYTRTEI
jgi:hypothetical protein